MTSVKNKLLSNLRHRRKAVPFFLNELYEFGSKSAVQRTIKILIKDGTLVRLGRGIYSRPKSLRYADVLFFATSQSMAQAWAKKYGYKIVPQGMEEAYRLGMQTQAPMKKIFWKEK